VLWIAALCAGIFWAISSPISSSPDDDYHLGEVWCLGTDFGPSCDYVGPYLNMGRDQVSIPVLNGYGACYAFKPEVSATCQSESAGIFTANGSYPKGFYAAMSLLVGDDVVRSVLNMRVVGFVLSLVMLVGAALLLPNREPFRVLLIVAAASVPLGIFIFASNNPSGVAVSAETSAFLATVALCRQSTWRRRIWIAAAVAGFIAVSAATRPDGLVLSVLAVLLGLAAALGIPRILASRRFYGLMVALGLAAIVALALLVKSRLPADTSASEVINTMLATVQYYFTPLAAKLGWLDTVPPDVVWVVKTIVIGIAVGVALRIASGRRVVVVLAVAAVMVIVPAYWNLSDGFSLQPRYVLPLLLVFAAVLVIDVNGSRVRLTRGQAFTIALLASGTNALALHTNIRRYVTGTDASWFNLDRGAEWWWDWSPLSPMVVWLGGSLAFTIAVLLLAYRAADRLQWLDTDHDAVDSVSVDEQGGETVAVVGAQTAPDTESQEADSRA
jgi:hypothetical protein